jgi:hypothetical protein
MTKSRRIVLGLESLESRLVPSPVISFSPDQSVVYVQTDGVSYAIPRPVLAPWGYSPSGNTYWVSPGGSDQNPGLLTSPFATIQHAIDVASPGDLVYVEAGTYDEALTFTKSGQPGTPIIVSCAPGDLGMVLVTPPAGYAQGEPDGSVVTFSTADNVWLNGLLIQGTKGTPGAPAAEHYSADGVTFEAGAGLGDEVTNCVIFDCLHCGIKELDHGGEGMLLQGNVIFDNGTTGLDHGIYMPADNVIMDGNVIFNNAGWGIQSYPDPYGQVITHNVLFGNHLGGILIAGSYNTVEYNTVSYDHIGLMYFRGWCVDNVVEYNVFSGNDTDGTYDNGVTQGNPSGNDDDFNVYGLQPDYPFPLGPHDTVDEVVFRSAHFGDYRLLDSTIDAGAYA